MNLYSFPYFHALAERLVLDCPDLVPLPFTSWRFPNEELFTHLQTPAKGDCLALGSVQPPDEHLASFLLLCDTLRRNGASSVTALLPYLAYSRQEKHEECCSQAAAWIGNLLRASGVSRVLTLDVHSSGSAQVFPIPLISQPSTTLFARTLTDLGKDACIVSPDEGGVSRCEALRLEMGLSLPTIRCRKWRTSVGVRSELFGKPAQRAIVFDDILDTGGTLISCCEQLVRAGTKEIHVAVTHGLFTGCEWERLWKLNVRSITCTDSTAYSKPNDERIRVISCAPALVEALKRYSARLEPAHA